MRCFTDGEIIPWGFGWFVPTTFPNLKRKRYLTIFFRLPFYWKDYNVIMDEITWGSAAFLWVVGVKLPDIRWIPDYSFSPFLPKEEETFRTKYDERKMVDK